MILNLKIFIKNLQKRLTNKLDNLSVSVKSPAGIDILVSDSDASTPYNSKVPEVIIPGRASDLPKITCNWNNSKVLKIFKDRIKLLSNIFIMDIYRVNQKFL